MAEPKTTVLAELQKNFCLINLCGEIRIADKNKIQSALANITQTEVSFYKKQDGILLMRRYLETLPINSDVKKDMDNFLINPNTYVFDEIAFSPLNLPQTTLNYWIPPTARPILGSWKELREFLLHVICANDENVFNYLTSYLAHMLQKPQEKPGVMIVMLGGQGTGKGTFFSLLKKIWARTTLQVSDISEVLGTFNAALERNYIVCMDEALFTGDKKSLEKLKSLITEPQCRIEQKYQPSRTIDSYHRFFAASNNEHFAKVDTDDRRFLFLRVSDKYQGDLVYFENLHKIIADGSQVRAMVYDLLAMNISFFNVRSRPKTEEHLNQKLQSLDGFERYWYELLQSGQIDSCNPYSTSWGDEPAFIATQALLESYKGFNRNADRYNPIQTNSIAKSLQKSCPSANSSRVSISNRLVRGYQLPSLERARREFEIHMGSRMQWDSDNDEIQKIRATEAQEISHQCSD